MTARPAWPSPATGTARSLVCGAVLQNASGDHFQIYELAFDRTWVSISPTSASIAPGGEQEISITLDPSDLPEGYYRTDIRFFSEVMGTRRPCPCASRSA